MGYHTVENEFKTLFSQIHQQVRRIKPLIRCTIEKNLHPTFLILRQALLESKLAHGQSFDIRKMVPFESLD